MPKSKKKRKSKSASASLTLSPIAIQNTLSEANMALGHGEVERAQKLAKKVLRADAQNTDAMGILGNALADANRYEEAVRYLQKAISIKPTYDRFNDLGIALAGLGQHQDAIDAYQQSLHVTPGASVVLNNLGLAQFELGQTEDAVDSYNRAINAEPTNPFIRYNLFEALERRNRIEELQTALDDAVAAIGPHPQFALAKASLLKKQKQYQEAIDALSAVHPEQHQTMILDPKFWRKRVHMLGDLFDRLDDTSQAMTAFQESNRLIDLYERPTGVNKNDYLARVKMLTDFFTAFDGNDWPPLVPMDDHADPIFLVGFPRSGTTLLDVILRGHPNIATLEEYPLISTAVTALHECDDREPQAIRTMTAEDMHRIRAAYFNERTRHLADDERQKPVIIDKLPLNLIEAGFIQRIFPNAKFILALRHPCDSVLSCYMHTFKLNSAMANFLTLEDAAKLYDQAFSLWELYRQALPLSVFTVRYEDVVADLDNTVRPLISFLNLEWHDGVLDHTGTARKSRIDTPSYNQVIEPIYKRADGRWTKYEPSFDAVMPNLSPWIEKHGYK